MVLTENANNHLVLTASNGIFHFSLASSHKAIIKTIETILAEPNESNDLQ